MLQTDFRLDRRKLLIHSAGAGAAGMMAWHPLFASAKTSKREWRSLFVEEHNDTWTFFQQDVGEQDLHNVVTFEDGMLHFLGPKFSGDGSKPGHIATKEEFSDFHLRLEYRWGDNRWPPRKLQRRNSGILYHMRPETGILFPDCVEFQIEEGDVGDAVMVNTLALQGPLLGGTPLWPNWIPAFSEEYQDPVVGGGYRRQWHAHSGHYEKLNDWNTVDLYAFEDRAAHLVNGRIVNTLFKLRSGNPDDGLAPLTRGRIALEFELAEITFRNIMVRPLSSASIELIKKQGSD